VTLFATLILLCLAVALVASAACAAARQRASEIGFDRSAEGTGEVESELLRRPLRSRYGA
jgi:hypothetical protein